MRAAWWWIDRWRFSSAYNEMTLAEQGAYRNLLDQCWVLEGGPLPLDEVELAALCGKPKEWPRVRVAVLAHFVRGADGWHNLTVEKIIRESKRKAKNQRRYLASIEARRALSPGHMTGQMSGHMTRSLSPAEKNSDSEQRADAGALGLGGLAPAGTGGRSRCRGPECVDELCCDVGAARAAENARRRLAGG